MRTLNLFADVTAEWIDGSRIAVVVAHPDDETIGCGGLLTRLVKANVVMVTDGAPGDAFNARRAGFETAQHYAQARARELRSALSIAGVADEQILTMGVQDGGVWRDQISITQQLAVLFAERKIEAVFTHAFEGGHSDHDGVAYCVHMAAGLLLNRGPTIVEMPFYHEGAGGLTFQTFCDGEDGIVVALSPLQASKKRAMFEAYSSQRHILDRLDSRVERYRLARRYDFRSPPNGGVLRYHRLEAALGLPDWMRAADPRRPAKVDALARVAQPERRAA
jgi:N-acetylglucosamine malate deacetylase 2